MDEDEDERVSYLDRLGNGPSFFVARQFGVMVQAQYPL